MTPYVLAIGSITAIILLILWGVWSASADNALTPDNAPPPLLPATRTPVPLPTLTPVAVTREQTAIATLGDSLSTANTETSVASGVELEAIEDSEYNNRVALPPPGSPDTVGGDGLGTALLPTPIVDTGDQQSGGLIEQPTPGTGTGLAPLPTPDTGIAPEPTPVPQQDQGGLAPLPTPDTGLAPLPTPDVGGGGNTNDQTTVPANGGQASASNGTPNSGLPPIPTLESSIFLALASDLATQALTSGGSFPVNVNAAAGVEPGERQTISEIYRVEDVSLSIFTYRGELRNNGWLLYSDTGDLGPLVYEQSGFTFVVSGLTPDQMAELGEAGEGVALTLYRP